MVRNSRSYLDCLDKLVDEYNNTYRHYIGKKPIDVDYSGQTGEFKTNTRAPNFKVSDRVRTNRKLFYPRLR